MCGGGSSGSGNSNRTGGWLGGNNSNANWRPPAGGNYSSGQIGNGVYGFGSPNGAGQGGNIYAGGGRNSEHWHQGYMGYGRGSTPNNPQPGYSYPIGFGGNQNGGGNPQYGGGPLPPPVLTTMTPGGATTSTSTQQQPTYWGDLEDQWNKFSSNRADWAPDTDWVQARQNFMDAGGYDVQGDPVAGNPAFMRPYLNPDVTTTTQQTAGPTPINLTNGVPNPYSGENVPIGWYKSHPAERAAYFAANKGRFAGRRR